MVELALDCTAPEVLLDLKQQWLVPCVYHFYRNPPHIVAGRGCRLFDHAGRAYLDCYSGVTVMSAGHSNEDIIEPAIEQIRTLQHTTTIYLTEPILRLAEALAAITPEGLTRSFFCASGTEAVEGALLLATLHTRREEIVAFTGSLHGRTRWAMNATGLDMWRTDPHPMPGVHRARFGDLEHLEDILRDGGDRIAAVVGEPVQGNGGIVVPEDEFWPGVRRLCDRYGVMLVFDEVQSGMNRTGRWFAGERWSIAPDILAVSKALGNGFPIAAFITTDEVAASYRRPGASTHGGNPVSARAALATIAYHERHDLGRCARERGGQLRLGLAALAADRSRCLGATRGAGLMLGMPILDANHAPDAARCDAVLEGLKDRGVLAGKSGPDRNVLTFMPPLVISAAEVEAALQLLEETINATS